MGFFVSGELQTVTWLLVIYLCLVYMADVALLLVMDMLKLVVTWWYPATDGGGSDAGGSYVEGTVPLTIVAS